MQPSQTMIDSYIEKHKDTIDNAYLEGYPEKATTEYYDTEHYQLFCNEYAKDCLIQDMDTE